jgi:hypothetical protein
LVLNLCLRPHLEQLLQYTHGSKQQQQQDAGGGSEGKGVR